jgi:hypothetical protein
MTNDECLALHRKQLKTANGTSSPEGLTVTTLFLVTRAGRSARRRADAKGVVDLFNGGDRGRMLASFNAIERFDTHACPTSKFCLRPAHFLTIANDVARENRSHRRNGWAISARVRFGQHGHSPVLGFWQYHESLAVENNRLNVY